MKKEYCWNAGSGHIELFISEEVAHLCSHPGAFHITEDIRTLTFSPPVEHIKK